MTTMEVIREIKWKLPGTQGYIGIHLAALIGLIWGVVYAPTPFSITIILGVFLGYYIRMFFVTVIAHRCLSHRVFDFKWEGLLIFAAILFTMCVQKGPLWWAAIHRKHHQHSDTDKDPHNPDEGFLWAQIGWFLSGRYDKTPWEKIGDLKEKKGLLLVEKYNLLGPVFLGVVYYILGLTYNAGGFGDYRDGLYMLLVGFFGSTVILSQFTSLINSLAHKWGKRSYDTNDKSRNSIILALITNGEGWHNNHHRHQNSAWSGEGYERVIDHSGVLIALMRMFGLITIRSSN